MDTDGPTTGFDGPQPPSPSGGGWQSPFTPPPPTPPPSPPLGGASGSGPVSSPGWAPPPGLTEPTAPPEPLWGPVPPSGPTPPGGAVPPAAPAPGSGPRGGGSGRSALVGAIVGALVAALVMGGLWIAFPRNSGSTTTNIIKPASRVERNTLDIPTLLAKVRASVVSIKTGATTTLGTQEAAGSGIVLTSDGLVLTNAHVIAGALAIEVTLSDGSTRRGSVVGSFPDSDVALIRLDDASNLTPAELGSSDALQVGDDVVAIGNALNLGAQPTVTLGIVSAKDRSISAENVTLEHLIQTDAAINPGNSGGPLINARGQVVGVNTAIIKNSQSLGFSLAIDEIKPLIEELKAGKGTINSESAFLGVTTTNLSEQPADVKTQFGITESSGAFVTGTETGSAAEAAGLQPGDVIVGINGAVVTGKDDVGAVVREHKPGDKVTIEFRRQGKNRSGEATLGRRGG